MQCPTPKSPVLFLFKKQRMQRQRQSSPKTVRAFASCTTSETLYRAQNGTLCLFAASIRKFEERKKKLSSCGVWNHLSENLHLGRSGLDSKKEEKTKYTHWGSGTRQVCSVPEWQMRPSCVNGVSLHQFYSNTPNIFVFKQWILLSPLFASESDWK